MTALRRYTDLRTWLHQLARSSVHAGTGAIIGAAGTNTLEGMGPTAFAGLGLSLSQMAAVFLSAAFIEALRRIHSATAETQAPFAP